jgi:glycosyltransferase involved in cell wall biosynthesis
MISVCTSTYNNTPEQLSRLWASLKNQTFTDWCWTVYDDSTNPDTWNILWGFCADERYRIELFKPHVPSRGNIGLSKRNCFGLAKGDILVEVDADDELTPDALHLLNLTFTDMPSIGFIYSDWCEIFPDGSSGRYPEGWAFGYGKDYWSAEHNVWVMQAPPLNTTTLSHIVSAPNHVRAWRASTYHAVGGHNPALPVADDYDLVVRTALATDCLHLPKMLYRQHISPVTAQRQRNGLIQKLVGEISLKYKDRVQEKFGGL